MLTTKHTNEKQKSKLADKLSGKWEIMEMELWAKEDIDLT